jgi:serine O-acetyltransferase
VDRGLTWRSPSRGMVDRSSQEAALQRSKHLTRSFLSVRAMPLLLGFAVAGRNRATIRQDVERWQQISADGRTGVFALLWLLTRPTHEFRNLYYHRVCNSGPAGLLIGHVLALVFRPLPTLFLRTRDIGPGLFINQGFATTVDARAIGANCWIDQQVTIGYDSFLDAPTVENNVVVSAGAIVIGGVLVGHEAHIGAGAVVTKDVPAGMVAVGVPAHHHAPGPNARFHPARSS